MRWFVLHALSGHEEKVAQTLRHMQETGRLDDDVAEILVPYEKKLESHKGKKREVQRKMYPGYVLVKMNLTNENRHILRQVQGVIGFVGSVDTPQPLTENEVDQIINRMHQEEPEIDLAYSLSFIPLRRTTCCQLPPLARISFIRGMYLKKGNNISPNEKTMNSHRW